MADASPGGPQLRRRECVPWAPAGAGSSGEVLVVGRFRPLPVKVLSRRWLAHGGLRVSAGIGGVVVVAQVIAQPGPAARHDQVQGDRVEVWVHVEGPAGWRRGGCFAGCGGPPGEACAAGPTNAHD